MDSNKPKDEKKPKEKPKKIDKELVENAIELFFILSGSGKTIRR